MIITSSIQLKIGNVFDVIDIESKKPARCKILREASKQEYLAEKTYIEHIPQGYYYEVSID